MHEALNCYCMRQGDGACSDVMMVKHACSKQRVGLFLITSYKRKRGKVEFFLSLCQRANLIPDKRLITYIGHQR